jgi:hypothetical protein
MLNAAQVQKLIDEAAGSEDPRIRAMAAIAATLMLIYSKPASTPGL